MEPEKSLYHAPSLTLSISEETRFKNASESDTNEQRAIPCVLEQEFGCWENPSLLWM